MESGAEVAIIGTSDKVYQVADEFKARGFVCYGVKADLSDRDQCKRSIQQVRRAAGRPGYPGACPRHPAPSPPTSSPTRIGMMWINTNLNSVFWLSRAASNIFKAKGYGKIIMIASMCSWFGGKTVPASRCKGGVMQLCKAFSNDLLQYGINVNAIAPGYMDTGNERGPDRPEEPQVHPAALRRADPAHSRSPLGHPDDMKGCCIFLASHASDYSGRCHHPCGWRLSAGVILLLPYMHVSQMREGLLRRKPGRPSLICRTSISTF